MRLQQVTGPECHHGEGPVWSSSWGGLRWVDVLAGDIMRLDGDRVSRHHVGDRVSAVRPREGGGVVVALERRFGVLDAEALHIAEGLATPISDAVFDNPLLVFNEGGTDPDGRFYCGTEHASGGGGGALWRLDADHLVHRVFDGVAVSNGLAWSPDGAHVYYVDSVLGSLDVLDYDMMSGLTNRRTLVQFAHHDGVPDGICVDAMGGIWVALWDGFSVRRYTSSGQLDGVVTLPVPRVTACTFGGPTLDTLYFTTSRYEVDVARYPDSGAVFAIKTGHMGLPAAEFAG